jgi:hypothetical protein
MLRLLCFAIIRLLHYLLDTYMCKIYNGWDILVISRQSVAGYNTDHAHYISCHTLARDYQYISSIIAFTHVGI